MWRPEDHRAVVEALLPCLTSLLGVFGELKPALTQPGWRNGLVIFAGWVLTNGQHAVTRALVSTGVAQRRHWEAFHRFFSRGTWNPDQMGLLLLDRLVRSLPKDASLRFAIDDTLASKKGPKVFGIGSHLDPVRTTKAFKVFCFGHVWVILAVVVSVPFSKRPWALPILFRLYRNKKEATRKGSNYQKKTELTREMLDIIVQWTNGVRIEVAMDCAYCNDTVMRGLPSSVVVVGSMRPDAALTASPKPKPTGQRRGRPPVRGVRLPSPEKIARDGRQKWKSCTLRIYGELRSITYKTIDAQWYRACGARLLRIVIVQMEGGTVPIRVYFSTDTTLPAERILMGYAARWSVEVCFRDLKQLLGFGDSSARKAESVLRTAPFVGLTYTILVIWFMEGAHASVFAAPPFRPWYSHKSGLCFADILRAAQRVLVHLDVLDPARSIDDLGKRSALPNVRAEEPLLLVS